MALLGNGRVLLNDARKAASLQEGWLREDLAQQIRSVAELGDARFNEASEREGMEELTRRLHQLAETMAQHEERTMRDLARTPLKVSRIAGVFQGLNSLNL